MPLLCAILQHAFSELTGLGFAGCSYRVGLLILKPGQVAQSGRLVTCVQTFWWSVSVNADEYLELVGHHPLACLGFTAPLITSLDLACKTSSLSCSDRKLMGSWPPDPWTTNGQKGVSALNIPHGSIRRVLELLLLLLPLSYLKKRQ